MLNHLDGGVYINNWEGFVCPLYSAKQFNVDKKVLMWRYKNIFKKKKGTKWISKHIFKKTDRIHTKSDR